MGRKKREICKMCSYPSIYKHVDDFAFCSGCDGKEEISYEGDPKQTIKRVYGKKLATENWVLLKTVRLI